MMSVRDLIARVTGHGGNRGTVEGLRLTKEIARAIEHGQTPNDRAYVQAAIALGLDRDDALMSMFGEKGMGRAGDER